MSHCRVPLPGAASGGELGENRTRMARCESERLLSASSEMPVTIAEADPLTAGRKG